MSTTTKNLFFALTFAILGLSSCEKAAIDCTDLYADVSRAQDTYYANQSTTNCMAYADALNAYVNASCQDAAGFITVAAQLPCKQN